MFSSVQLGSPYLADDGGGGGEAVRLALGGTGGRLDLPAVVNEGGHCAQLVAVAPQEVQLPVECQTESGQQLVAVRGPAAQTLATRHQVRHLTTGGTTQNTTHLVHTCHSTSQSSPGFPDQVDHTLIIYGTTQIIQFFL